jgi:hypothetical protein
MVEALLVHVLHLHHARSWVLPDAMSMIFYDHVLPVHPEPAQAWANGPVPEECPMANVGSVLVETRAYGDARSPSLRNFVTSNRCAVRKTAVVASVMMMRHGVGVEVVRDLVKRPSK